MHTLTFCLIALALSLPFHAFSWQVDRSAEGGSIAGRVAAADSEENLHSVITWTRQSSITETKLPFTGAVVTDENGDFSISGLAPGTYILCADTPSKSHVNPCLWESEPRRVEVKAGQRVSAVELTMQPAVTLRFEIADQEQRVATKERTSGIWISAYVPLPEGRRVDLPLVRTEKGVHIIEALVPADRDIPIIIDGAGLRFTDLEGRPWSADRAAYVVPKTPSAQRQKQVGIEVVGR